MFLHALLTEKSSVVPGPASTASHCIPTTSHQLHSFLWACIRRSVFIYSSLHAHQLQLTNRHAATALRCCGSTCLLPHLLLLFLLPPVGQPPRWRPYRRGRGTQREDLDAQPQGPRRIFPQRAQQWGGARTRGQRCTITTTTTTTTTTTGTVTTTSVSGFQLNQSSDVTHS